MKNRSFFCASAPGLFLLSLMMLFLASFLTACSDDNGSSTTAPVATVVAGAPADPSSTAVFSIAVGGSEVVAYKYNLDNANGGVFGAENSIATPISGTLADGQHTLRIIGRDSQGVWQAEANATIVTWTIQVVNYSYDRKIGGTWSFASAGQLNEGMGVAVDASGNTYLADAANNRIQKFDSNGVFVRAWGTFGTGDTNLKYPRGIALDTTSAYVADGSNYRVVKFDLDGTYQGQWSTGDWITEGFPTSIAQFGGVIYVTRRGASNAVTGYDTNGAVVYGPRATGENPFTVAVDSSGNVFVGCDSGRIYKLPADLSSSVQFYDSNVDGGYTPEGIGPDGSGNLYVSFSNHTIRKINSEGVRVTTFGTSWSAAPGSFMSPKGVVVSGASFFVAEYNRAQKLALNGTSQLIYANLSDDDGNLKYPQNIALDSTGNIYVTDQGNNRIQKFAANGSYLTKWGIQGTEDGNFSYPWGIAVDGTGSVYVSDHNNNRIQKFGADGTYVTKWGALGVTDGLLDEPTGMTIDAAGNLVVMDSMNHRGQVFTPTGDFVRKWGSYGSADGQMNEPDGVAVDALGNTYAVDVENQRVQKFSSLGAFILKWGTEGTANNQFSFPYGMAIDHGGNIYVADRNNDRVLKFKGDGTYLLTIGSTGTGDGQMNDPTGVMVDPAGNLYVVDQSNHRIQVYRPQ